MANKPSNKKKKPSSWLKWVILGGFALLALGIIGGLFLNKPDEVVTGLPAEISVDEAYDMYNEGAFLLDVRTQEEWNEYHAPGATLIPLGELPARLHEVPQDKPVVVVCRSGNRSQQGRDILLQAGYQDVTSMAGGLKSWQAQGYPVTTGP